MKTVPIRRQVAEDIVSILEASDEPGWIVCGIVTMAAEIAIYYRRQEDFVQSVLGR